MYLFTFKGYDIFSGLIEFKFADAIFDKFFCVVVFIGLDHHFVCRSKTSFQPLIGCTDFKNAIFFYWDYVLRNQGSRRQLQGWLLPNRF